MPTDGEVLSKKGGGAASTLNTRKTCCDKHFFFNTRDGRGRVEEARRSRQEGSDCTKRPSRLTRTSAS